MRTTTRQRRRAWTAGALASTLLLGACGPGANTEVQVPFSATTGAAAKGKDGLTWLLAEEPSVLDPDIDASTADDTVLANVCERLMQIQPDLSLAPGLATSAKWTDDTHLVLTITEDAHFHDGTPITADDVLYSLKRHAAEGAGESDEYGNVVGMTVSGDHEVTIETSQPDAILLQALGGDGGIVWNRAVIEEYGDQYGLPGTSDACSGPYEVGAWKAGTSLTLTKADDYWNPERAALSDTITFRWAEDSAVVNSLRAGEADGSYLDAASSAVPLLGNDDLTVTQGPATNAWVLIPTARGAGTDPRVRRALSLALERDGINTSAFGGLAQPGRAPVGSGAWGFETDVFAAAAEQLREVPATPTDTDLEAARDLVEEAKSDGAPTDLIIASSADVTRNVIANGVLSAAESIGLEPTVRTVPASQYGDFYGDEDLRDEADLWIDEYYISKTDPLGFYKNGGSGASVNYAGFADPAYDDLVARAQGATDDTERSRLTIDLQRRWNEAMVWIPVVESPSTLVTGAGVTGAPASAAFLYYPWAADLGAAEGAGE
ncbi:ABC transporter substrate-binding protein [Brevibacterium sp. 1718]|uniref:ABC transporter substrate-binding protein n=1 Tax=Brevibacterium sp. 1718 TaxID=3413510 RepID=UPI003DA89A4C